MSEFYTFGSKLLNVDIQVSPRNLKNDPSDDGLHDQHRLITGDYQDISFPVIFDREYGKNIGDLIDTGWPSLYLISANLIEIMEENALTGWATFECKVYAKDGEINGYKGLSITGRCGEINYSQTEKIEKQRLPDGPIVRYYKGKPFDIDTWDGSDIFLPKHYFGPFITSKAKKAFSKAGLTNIKCVALSEVETPHFGLPAKWKYLNL